MISTRPSGNDRDTPHLTGSRTKMRRNASTLDARGAGEKRERLALQFECRG